MPGKIAWEEHFVTADFAADVPDYVNPEAMSTIRQRLSGVDGPRLEAMDAAGIDLALLSLTSPAVQGEPDAERAVRRARDVNDDLAGIVAAHPDRYAGLAALPLQDPSAAVEELDRCVTRLGFPAVMLNGYTTIDSTDTGVYYDDARFLPFWERVQDLGVPVYLHSRDPLPGSRGIYAGHPELFGAVWTFTVETATHALRLITSGLFDRFPKLTVVLGHLGETLPTAIWRIEHRLNSMRHLCRLDKPASHYLRTNFYVTTSGNFRTQTLQATLAELGADRVLFATDYPFESMTDAAAWFDTTAISETDRGKIARSNSEALLARPAALAPST